MIENLRVKNTNKIEDEMRSLVGVFNFKSLIQTEFNC